MMEEEEGEKEQIEREEEMKLTSKVVAFISSPFTLVHCAESINPQKLLYKS
jgi:hypothetical protein